MYPTILKQVRVGCPGNFKRRGVGSLPLDQADHRLCADSYALRLIEGSPMVIQS